jgi:hypothetical protein
MLTLIFAPLLLSWPRIIARMHIPMKHFTTQAFDDWELPIGMQRVGKKYYTKSPHDHLNAHELFVVGDSSSTRPDHQSTS